MIFKTIISNIRLLIYKVQNYRNSAKDMVNLSQKYSALNKFEDLAYFEPYYLKEFVATTPKDKVLKK